MPMISYAMKPRRCVPCRIALNAFILKESWTHASFATPPSLPHIAYGKSTLNDRLLELTGSLTDWLD
jgi:hypothetical protein